DRLLREARRVSEETFEELNELRKAAVKAENVQQVNEAKVQLVRRLNDAQDQLGTGQEEEEDNTPLARPLKPGDTVILKKLGTPATVLTVGADGALTLQAGILRVTAKTEEVKLAESASPDKKKFLRETESKLRNLSVSPEVDLRGLTGEEALLMLERYLDSARMAKLNSVRIIHGKGTGALRKTVQDYLRRSGDVRSFRIGRYGEGEDGVTIAEIKA
ncbi:MAG: Smr/MutS family protein, partial [Oscillospiraceae bacterium]|nr:Smr/MutS family protein [Oscillospiraceae bacterium]